MKHNISESLSKIVYHYTSLLRALNILTIGEFILTSRHGNSSELISTPKQYSYYLSTTRTRHGVYHRDSLSGVIFNLDGDYYNHHYVSKPVDYWGPNFPVNKREAEDRLYSNKPSLSINGVTSVHILIDVGKYSSPDTMRSRARKILIAAKKQGIPAFVYTDRNAWLNQDTTNRVTEFSKDLANKPLDSYGSYHRRDKLEWYELINVSNTKYLSSRAKSYAEDLSDAYKYSNGELNPSDFYTRKMISKFDNDMQNSRTPNSLDWKLHVRVVDFMQKHKFSTSKDIIWYLSKKWYGIMNPTSSIQSNQNY